MFVLDLQGKGNLVLMTGQGSGCDTRLLSGRYGLAGFAVWPKGLEDSLETCCKIEEMASYLHTLEDTADMLYRAAAYFGRMYHTMCVPTDCDIVLGRVQGEFNQTAWIHNGQVLLNLGSSVSVCCEARVQAAVARAEQDAGMRLTGLSFNQLPEAMRLICRQLATKRVLKFRGWPELRRVLALRFNGKSVYLDELIPDNNWTAFGGWSEPVWIEGSD